MDRSSEASGRDEEGESTRPEFPSFYADRLRATNVRRASRLGDSCVQ